ncbi:MAG: histidine kinase [Saprospiraceae bacterium]
MDKKQKHFWIAQIGGWSLATFLNILVYQLLNPYPGMVRGSLVAMGSGMLISLLYREAIQQMGWKERSPRAMILPILLSVPIVTAIWAITFAIICTLFYPYLLLPRVSFFQYFAGVFFSGNLIMLIWVTSYFAYQYFSRFSQAEVEKWKMTAIAREAQLGALKAQINPHFMFNALNNIRALILENQNRSREMLTHLSELLRYNFSSTEQQLVPLENELEIVQSYLELVSIQYEQRLQAKIEHPEDLSELRVPPMIIQLLVENAVKHGVALSPTGGKIFIDVEHVDHLLHITVRNTGYLNGQNRIEEPSGVGLANIRERLRLLYDHSAHLSITEHNGWVKATIIIPNGTPHDYLSPKE